MKFNLQIDIFIKLIVLNITVKAQICNYIISEEKIDVIKLLCTPIALFL